MRPEEPDRPVEACLFEQWMGMTPAQWEALGKRPDADGATDPPEPR